MVLLRMFTLWMCVRVHNYGYEIDLCSLMCNLQFILIANTFLPLHTHHSNPSYIFLHVLFVFRAVSQVIVPVIPWFWELVSCTDLSGAKEIYYSVRLSKKVMDYEIVAKCCTRPVHFKILTISFTRIYSNVYILISRKRT